MRRRRRKRSGKREDALSFEPTDKSQRTEKE